MSQDIVNAAANGLELSELHLRKAPYNFLSLGRNLYFALRYPNRDNPDRSVGTESVPWNVFMHILLKFGRLFDGISESDDLSQYNMRLRVRQHCVETLAVCYETPPPLSPRRARIISAAIHALDSKLFISVSDPSKSSRGNDYFALEMLSFFAEELHTIFQRCAEEERDEVVQTATTVPECWSRTPDSPPPFSSVMVANLRYFRNLLADVQIEAVECRSMAIFGLGADGSVTDFLPSAPVINGRIEILRKQLDWLIESILPPSPSTGGASRR